MGIAQIPSSAGDIDENESRCLHACLEAKKKEVSLLVFPELVWSGYFLSKAAFYSLAAPATRDSRPVRFFRELSRKLEGGIVFSFPERDRNHLFITCGFVDEKNHTLHFYRKSKLWGKEKYIFTPGEKNYEPLPTQFGQIGLLVCYDIEFPEPARTLAKKETDIIICPSVWSNQAETRWNVQLPCRALDNQCFVVGANTIHSTACGQSQVCDPYGNVVTKASSHEKQILTTFIDRDTIKQARQDIPYLEELDF